MAGSPQIVVEFLAKTAGLQAGLKNAEKSTQSFGTSVGKLGKAGVVAAGVAGLGALTAVAKIGFDEMAQGAKVGAQTAAVLKSTGSAAHVTAGHVESLAGALLKKSGVDDEAIQSGENLLLTFTRIQNTAGKGNDIFDQATKTMLDMSTALGQDTSQSAIQLGKALNDPVKGMTALRKVGVSFTEGQTKQVAAMVKSGNVMGAQKLILAELNKEFGGSAAAAGKTLPGQINVLKESFSNLAGEMMSSLAPAFEAITSFLTAHPALFKALVIGVLALAAAMVALNVAMAVTAAVTAGVALPVLAIIAAIALLVVAAVLVVKHWAAIKAATIAAWNAVKSAVTTALAAVRNAIQAVIGWIRANWPLLLGILAGPFGLAVALIVKHWAAIKAATVAAWNAIKGALSSAMSAIRGVITAGFNAIVGVVKSAVSRFVGAIRAGAGLAAGAARAIVAAVKGAFSGAASWLVQAGKDAVMGLVHGIESVKDLPGKALHAITSRLPHTPWGSTAWQAMHEVGKTAGKGLADGITASTPQAVAAAKAIAKRAMDAAKAQAASQSSALQDALGKAFEARQAAAKTPAEQAIANMEAARAQQQRQQALADAQAQLAAATNADELLAAQKAYEAAQYDITIAGLQQQAAAERTELDGQQALQQAAFTKRLAALNTYLASGHATAKGANARIAKLAKDFGLDLATIGALIGPSMAGAIEKSIPAAVKAAIKLTDAVKDAIRKGLKIGSPSRWAEEQGKFVSQGLALGIARNANVANLALAGLTGGDITMAEGEAAPVHVRVFIGDTELRGMVRTEIGSDNARVARRLLAGTT